MLDELPPQIQVGTGLHSLDVKQQETEHFLTLTLIPSGRKHVSSKSQASRAFAPGEEADILPWLAVAGHAIGEHLDKESTRRLRQQGYRV